jgi:hypothetical protein
VEEEASLDPAPPEEAARAWPPEGGGEDALAGRRPPSPGTRAVMGSGGRIRARANQAAAMTCSTSG